MAKTETKKDDKKDEEKPESKAAKARKPKPVTVTDEEWAEIEELEFKLARARRAFKRAQAEVLLVESDLSERKLDLAEQYDWTDLFRGEVVMHDGRFLASQEYARMIQQQKQQQQRR